MKQVHIFSSHGIVHQTSCVATPQPNRIVERNHRHLLEIARALIFQSQVIIHWGESFLTTTYLINRLPSKVLKGKIPYGIIFEKSPSYHILKFFECLCYTNTLAHGKDKFQLRAIKCVFRLS